MKLGTLIVVKRILLSSPLELLWVAFVVYWVVSARRAGAPAHRDDARVRFSISALLLIGGGLIFGPADSVGWWDERFIGPLGVVRGAGLILTAAGLGLAVWARMHLGRFWTGDVAVLGRHELIERGPYARLRHPIYSGVLLAAAGTVVSIGERRALFGFACLMLGLWWKARREEGFMRRELGTAYDDYRQRTGFLIPPLRRRGARIR